MKFVEPQVYLIGETRIDVTQLKEMLGAIGGTTALDWFSKTQRASQSEGELLTEIAGRICYKSFGVGLNPNVTKIRQSSEDYIQNTLSKGDGSIFEHSSCTLRVPQRQQGVHPRAGQAQGGSGNKPRVAQVRATFRVRLLAPARARTTRKPRSRPWWRTSKGTTENSKESYDWESMNFDVKKRITSGSEANRTRRNGDVNHLDCESSNDTTRHRHAHRRSR